MFRIYPQQTFTCPKSTIETLKKDGIYPKLTIKILELRQLLRSGIFIVNFEHVSHLFLVFL